MKPILISIITLLLSFTSFSQELSKKEWRQLRKQLKKEQQAEEAAQKTAVVSWMVESRHFVLEADRLRDKRGNSANVSSSINFIASDSIKGVIQIGSNGYVGLNGVGGITVEGPITNYKSARNAKNGSFNVSYFVSTTSGTYDVRMIVYPEGRAEANISSNWPGSITYLGYLMPPHLSKVFKGTSY